MRFLCAVCGRTHDGRYRTRFPVYTNRKIPYSIMPDAYLKALAEKETRLLEEEEHYRQARHSHHVASSARVHLAPRL